MPKYLRTYNSPVPCPGTVTLDIDTVELGVYLYDGFSTIVTGALLLENPINFTAVQTQNDKLAVTGLTGIYSIDPYTGGVVISEIGVCGEENNSTATFSFVTNALDSSIDAAICGITLLGCNEGYEPHRATSPSECAYCEAEVNVEVIIFSLLAVILALCLILCLIVSIIAGRRYWYALYFCNPQTDFYEGSKENENNRSLSRFLTSLETLR